MPDDSAPAVVRQYFDAIDAEDAASVVDGFAPEALVATPPAGAESQERLVRSPSQLFRDLVDRGSVAWRHRLNHVHTDGAVSIVEGELVDHLMDQPIGGFVAVVETNASGKITAFRSYRRGDRAEALAAGNAQSWDAVLSAATDMPGAPQWLAEGLTRGARVSLPAESLPTGMSPSIEVYLSNSQSVAVQGRVGEAAEFCLVARGALARGVTSLDAYWCRLSDGEIAYAQRGSER